MATGIEAAGLVRRANQLRQMQLRYTGIMGTRHIQSFEQRIKILRNDIVQADEEGEITEEATEILDLIEGN